MKHLSPAVLVVLLAALSGAARAQTFTPQITQTVGAGSQESFFVLDFQDGSADHNYAFGYFYEGAKTGADMISALSRGAGLGVTTLYNGSVVNGFQFNGHSEAGFGADGYWSYWLGTDGQNWKSSGLGIKGRPLSNGSWDGWSWDANSSNLPPVTPATSAPVPEASTSLSFTLLLAFGTGGMVLFARKKVRA